MARYEDNCPPTTLDGGIDDEATALTVADGAGFPPVPFYARIDHPTEAAEYEWVLVTAAAGGSLQNWTVERSQGSTGAMEHEDGAVVTHGVPALVFDALRPFVIVDHASTASTARPNVPDGWGVIWRGTVVPDNILDGDDYVDFDPDLFAEAQLSGNVTLTTAGTWYDVLGFTLPPGKWLLMCALTLGRAATTLTQFVVRLTDGSTHYASGQAHTSSNNPQHTQIALQKVVTLAASTTVKVQATASVNSSIAYAATPTSGSGNNACTLTAVRIG